MQIKDAIAIVTGASSGIGRAVAVELASRGATVVPVARRAEEIERTAEQCRAHAPGSFAHRADLSVREQCEATIATVNERLGRVDILVNNAGISIRKPAAQTTVEDVHRAMDVNFFSAVHLTLAALPGMLERRRGSVVNVTSVAGYLPNPKESAYGASKAALSLWTHGLAVDLHDSGVHFGVLSPGPIATEIWDKDEFSASYSGKLYPPEVVAKGVARLVEREKVHMTVPRRFGFPPITYPMLGGPMRKGMIRYEERAEKRGTVKDQRG